MSLKIGNAFFRKKQYSNAILEYKKIALEHPLYHQALFNIRLCENLMNNSSLAEDGFHTNDSLNLNSYPEKQPLVSIIMPVFNVAAYLDASIMSVLGQTYKNIELIIVNDASTDNGEGIIRMYEKLDSRIRFINLEFNTLGGAGIPSNIGMDTAKGDYIAFADSDDILATEAVEKMVQCALSKQAEVVIADYATFNNDNRTIENSKDKINWNALPQDNSFTSLAYPAIFKLSPVPWRKLYKREFLDKHFIRFPEGDYFYEDNPLHWYVLTSAKNIALLDYPVAYHRLEREGQTMSGAAFKFNAQFCHLNSIKTYLLKYHYMQSEYWKELVDFCYRANWIVDKQDNLEFKNITKKRYSKTALSVEKLSGIPKAEIEAMRPSFYKRCKEYNESYPDIDLSIVIPVYNCVDLLPELLSSIEKIDLKVELFLIDDGSTDGSKELCEEYADKHPFAFCITQKNSGAGVARNVVIPLLTGEYSYFVDADDQIDPEALKRAFQFSKKNQNDLTLFKYQIEFYEKQHTRGMWNADQELWEELRKTNNNQSKKELASRLTNYPWNRIIKTSLLHDENIFFGKTVVHNDVPYHWHTIISAENIGIFNEYVCIHRKFKERNQITNIIDERRLMVLEAYRYTHHLLKRYSDYPSLFPNWQKFIRDLLQWAKERIPEEKMDFYKKRHKEIVEELKNIKFQ